MLACSALTSEYVAAATKGIIRIRYICTGRLTNILRILGAVIIAVSGCAGAFVLNSYARLGLKHAEGAISLVRFLRSEIECFGMPVPRALGRCPKNVLEACGYAEEAPPETVNRAFFGVCDGELRQILFRFGSELGRGYREEQLGLCDYCLSLLEERRRELAERLPSKRRINSALCLSAALAAVILLF